MQIGKYSIKTPLVLAPMAGITDATFRSICFDLGAGLTVSEMVSADTSLYASEKTLTRLTALENEENNPRSVQIVGSDPHKMAEAAAHNVTLGADIIDINMGCPAKKVCRKLAGSALLADPKLVGEILRQVVRSVSVPVTLKIRTGTERSNINGVEIAKIAENEGIQAIAVHGRTRADKFSGFAEYDTIKNIKQAIAIPVIANGDIRSGIDAVKVLEYTGADAVMIGRAAQGNPWIFREIAAYLHEGKAVQPPEDMEVYKTLSRHLQGLYSLHGEYRGVRIARKHIAWYCKEKKGAAEFRQKINTVDSVAEQLKLVGQFFDGAYGCTSGSAQSRVDAA